MDISAMERTQQARETENHDSIVSHTLWLSVMVQSQALEGLGRGGCHDLDVCCRTRTVTTVL